MRGRWVAPERARRWGGGGWGVRVVVGKTRMAVGDGRNAGMAVGASTDWRGRRASTDQSLEGYVTRAEERSRPRCRGASTGGGERAPRRVTHGLDADGNRISGGGETRCRKRQPLDQSDGTSATGIWYSMRQFRNDAPPTVRLFLYPLPPPHGRDRPSSRAPASPTRETGSGHRARRCPWRTGAASARRGETEPATTLDTPGRIRRY